LTLSGVKAYITAMNWCVSSSNAIKLIVAATLTPFIFAACVHTDLPAQVVTPASVGLAKLQIKVAVLADPALTIHEPAGFYDKLNPGLANTVRDALAANFETVEVVDDKVQAGNADLLAIPTAEIPFEQKPQKLTIAFTEPRTGKTIADLSSFGHFDTLAVEPDNHPVVYTALALVPLGPLLALPYHERKDAEKFNAGFGPVLVAMATDIADQASKDQAIRSLSSPHRPSTGK
jgi:hypothetical protein